MLYWVVSERGCFYIPFNAVENLSPEIVKWSFGKTSQLGDLEECLVEGMEWRTEVKVEI